MVIHSDVWVAALIRRVELAGAFAAVTRRGDTRGGAVMIKGLDRRRGIASLWVQTIDAGGEPIWMAPLAPGAEGAIDAHIARAQRIDPDVWVVEIEDADASRFLTEPVVKA